MSSSSNASTGHYTLSSELAQFCLPAAHRDRNQRVAWVDSICLIYLVIGLIGLKAPLAIVRAVPPLDEPVLTVIENVPQEVQSQQNDQEEVEEQNQDTSDAPTIVAVTLDSPAVNFSVPTVGNVLVAASASQAPPPKPMRMAEVTITNRILNLSFTGRGGDRPSPDYPQWALREGMRGTMVLTIEVDGSGTITNVQVDRSTGHPRLDSHTVNHIKRRFTFPSADGPRTYRLPVEYSPM